MATLQFTTEELAAEEWRPVVGYEGVYSVSNLGRIRREKPAPRTRPGFILNPRPTKHGYMQAALTCFNKTKHFSVHRLVIAAFVGTCPSNLCVNHIDGNKLNNRIQNLEYVTPKENGTHASVIGLYPRGADHWTHRKPECLARGEEGGTAKLTELQVRAIKHLLPVMAQDDIATLFSVTRGTITAINKGKIWKHVTKV